MTAALPSLEWAAPPGRRQQKADLLGWLAFRASFEDRFWSKVDRTGNGCRLWLCGTNRDGYGQFGVTHAGRTWNLLAHRVAWGLVHGVELGRDVVLRHRCDTPPCCNTACLVPGTQTENHADMVAKGRIARGERSGRRTHPETIARGADHWSRQQPDLIVKGEAVGTSKLTVADVLAIRARHAAGEKPTPISRDYGVTPEAIGMIVHRKNWRHLP